MNDLSQNNTPSSQKLSLSIEELQTLLQDKPEHYAADDEIDLAELWRGLVKQKWVILGITFVLTLAVVIASMMMTPKYESKVVLASVSSGDSAGGLMAKYGGLASLAGINLPSGGQSISLTQEALELIKSHQFLSAYITQHNLKPILFADSWDAEKQQWRVKSPGLLQRLKGALSSDDEPVTNAFVYEGMETLAEGEPNMIAAVKAFNDMLSVSEDSKSGLISLQIKWTNPVQARDWAMDLVKVVDNQLREEAIRKSEQTITYLNTQLQKMPTQDLKEIALNMIADNMKTVTFAKVNPEYVFKVLDPAIVNEQPVSPKKSLMAAVGMVLGLMLGIFVALILNFRANRKAEL